MGNFLKNSFFKMLVLINVIVAIFYLISRVFDSFARTVERIGPKLPSSWPVMGGLYIPGSGLKLFVQLFETPFKFIGSNIKFILVIDAILIIIAILLKVIQKRQQNNAIEGVVAAKSEDEKREALSNLMKSFK